LSSGPGQYPQRRAPARFPRPRAGKWTDGQYFVLQREGRRRTFGERQTEDSTTGAAQSRVDANRSGSRLADGRSRRAQRQSSPYSVAARDPTDGQRAVDRRVVFAVTVAALCERRETDNYRIRRTLFVKKDELSPNCS